MNYKILIMCILIASNVKWDGGNLISIHFNKESTLFRYFSVSGPAVSQSLGEGELLTKAWNINIVT